MECYLNGEVLADIEARCSYTRKLYFKSRYWQEKYDL